MTTLSAAQVAALVKQVGFPASVHVTMVAIARAESGYRVEARGGPNRNGTYDYGLFQINSVHGYDTRRLTSDAKYNTEAAYAIYKRQGLGAWSVYNSGKWRTYENEARQAVAQAANVTGSPVLPGSSGGTAQEGVTYGPPGPEMVAAGVGVPVAASEETNSPIAGLKVFGSEIWADMSTTIIGQPTFSAGMNEVPNLMFTIADPGGNMKHDLRNLWVRGARVQYADLDFRIDSISFEPGSHTTGQITITSVDDIVYALMNLKGSRTATGISATQWIAQEMALAGIDPNRWFLGESVPTQSTIARDDDDQSGEGGSGEAPSAWTTCTRLARELGKRVFVSGKRLVFGSSAFAMRWCAEAPVRVGWFIPDEGERLITQPTSRYTTVGNRSDVVEISARVSLNRAKFFRPGVPVNIKNIPGLVGEPEIAMLCSSITHVLGTDVDGADITITYPIDPPAQPPTAPTVAGANGGSTSAGGNVSGGGADGQIAQFVALALQQAGKRYVFGAEASPSDPNPRAFDCSELVEWAAARVGISPKVPDGSATQLAHCRARGTIISVQQGINTKGALLFVPGHVAISLGNGKVIEAANPSAGVRQGNANGRGWTAAARIPGARGYL